MSYKSSDVGVQATPVAVSADSSALPLKQQRGILPVTSDMRNSAARETRNHSDNHCKGMANTKEKTPMCQINELARFNKVRLWHEHRDFFLSSREGLLEKTEKNKLGASCVMVCTLQNFISCRGYNDRLL